MSLICNHKGEYPVGEDFAHDTDGTSALLTSCLDNYSYCSTTLAEVGCMVLQVCE